VIALGLWLPRSVTLGFDPRRMDYGLFSEATVLEQLNRDPEAEALYLKALQANPSAPFVHFNLGELAQKRTDWLTAEREFTEEIRVNPGYGRAWISLGQVQQSQGREDDALQSYREARRVRPDLLEAAQRSAEIWSRRAGFAKATGDSSYEKFCLAKVVKVQGGAVDVP
jgi:tetratricopeptide (TPR) repeat protein